MLDKSMWHAAHNCLPVTLPAFQARKADGLEFITPDVTALKPKLA